LIPSTVDDVFGATIDSPRTDAAFIQGLVDPIPSEDGRSDRVREIPDAGGYPILLTHWQSLFSAGLETGLAALNEMGCRVRSALGEEAERTICMELTRRTLETER
jgi:hypothetical protein